MVWLRWATAPMMSAKLAGPALSRCVPPRLRVFSRAASGARSLRRPRGGARPAEADYAVLLYAWTRPRGWFDFGGGSSKEFYLRAIGRTWSAMDAVETETEHGSKVTLHLPSAVGDAPYLAGKMAPGMLARFKIPGHGAVAINAGGLGRSFKESEFTGVVLGWDQQDYFVHALPAEEYQTYDTAVSAMEAYEVSRSLRIPQAYMLDFGHPEVHVFPKFPFGVYAALAIPAAYSRIEVLFGDEQLETARQANLLPHCAFQRHPSVAMGANQAAGLEQSIVSLRVDGVKVPVLVPSSQLSSV